MDKTFDDYQLDEILLTRTRTITEADIVNFAGLSGDFHELHMSEEYAKRGPFGRRIAHGALIFSISTGLMIQMGASENILAFYGLDKLRFVKEAKAVSALNLQPTLALVDGNRAPPLDCKCETIIGGDAKSLSIAAASIIAKVTRDRMMKALDRQYPDYGFAAHKGYGTAAHAASLARFGPCPEHRKSFAPIRTLFDR